MSLRHVLGISDGKPIGPTHVDYLTRDTGRNWPDVYRHVSLQLASYFGRLGDNSGRYPPHGQFVLLGSAAAFAGMFAYITASPFVYVEYFGVAPRHYGYFFGLKIVEIILMALLNARLLRYYGPERLLSVGAGVAALAGCALLLVAHMAAAIQLDSVQIDRRTSELWQVVS